MHVVFMNLAAARMTPRAHLDFALRGSRHAAPGIPASRIDRPRRAFAFIECDSQSVIVIEPLPIALLLRPLRMVRSRAMARLTRNIDLLIGGRIGARFQIIVLAQVSR